MSGATYTGQTAWEESQEEYDRRCESASSSANGWFGTILGVAISVVALALLVAA